MSKGLIEPHVVLACVEAEKYNMNKFTVLATMITVSKSKKYNVQKTQKSHFYKRLSQNFRKYFAHNF